MKKRLFKISLMIILFLGIVFISNCVTASNITSFFTGEVLSRQNIKNINTYQFTSTTVSVTIVRKETNYKYSNGERRS